MKQLHKPGEAKSETPSVKKEPLTEGLAKEKKPRGFYAKMSDDTLVQSAQKSIEERKIRNRKGLEEADRGMHSALCERHLLGRLEFKENRRDWASMSDDALVQSAQKFIEERKIRNRKGLENADPGMYRALWVRHLLDRVFAPIEQAQEQARKAEIDRQLREGIDLYLGREAA